MQIVRTRGDTVPDVITVSSAGTEDVVNLTGCAFKLTVNSTKDPVDSSTQLFQLDGIISKPESGVVEFLPTPEQANHVGYFYYDIEMTDSYGRVLTLVKDSYVFKQDITK